MIGQGDLLFFFMDASTLGMTHVMESPFMAQKFLNGE